MISAEKLEAPHRRSASRIVFAAFGMLFVALGTVGVFVPIWPTTIFFLLALWCFKRSSERLESWLLNHRVFGSTLRDWEASRSLTLRAKVIAISAIWVSIAVSASVVVDPWVRWLLAGIGLALTWYLGTRPTKRDPAYIGDSA